MAELKPCPFCGGKARLSAKNFAGIVEITICCMTCAAHLHRDAIRRWVAEPAAIEAWNRRVSDGV